MYSIPPRFITLSLSLSYRMIPKSSKYPPRPWVPNGSLKVRTTAATLLRFHMGPKMRFPNLPWGTQRHCSTTQHEANQGILETVTPGGPCVEARHNRGTWAPLGSGPSPCPSSGLCGRSAPLWTGRTDAPTAPGSSGGRGQTASPRSPWSSLYIAMTRMG